MRRILTFALLCPVLLGCGDLGTVGPGGDGDGDGDGDGQILACQAQMTVTGSLAPSGAIPAPEDGCVPFGTWTIDVALADQGDCPDVTFDAQYVYEVSEDVDNGGYLYNYPADPANPNVRIKVTSEGGSCAGNFEHYSDDGKTLILLKPFEDNLQITGSGYFEVYYNPQI